MKYSFISIVHVFLSFFFGFIACYTGFMGFIFSATGMWVDETKLMIGYAVVFFVSSLVLFLLVRKFEWFDILKQ